MPTANPLRLPMKCRPETSQSGVEGQADMHVCISLSLSIYIYIYICIYTHTNIYIYIYIYIYIDINIYVYSLCIYPHISTCSYHASLYIYMYIYIYMFCFCLSLHVPVYAHVISLIYTSHLCRYVVVPILPAVRHVFVCSGGVDPLSHLVFLFLDMLVIDRIVAKLRQRKSYGSPKLSIWCISLSLRTYASLTASI